MSAEIKVRMDKVKSFGWKMPEWVSLGDTSYKKNFFKNKTTY